MACSPCACASSQPRDESLSLEHARAHAHARGCRSTQPIKAKRAVPRGETVHGREVAAPSRAFLATKFHGWRVYACAAEWRGDYVPAGQRLCGRRRHQSGGAPDDDRRYGVDIFTGFVRPSLVSGGLQVLLHVYAIRVAVLAEIMATYALYIIEGDRKSVV